MVKTQWRVCSGFEKSYLIGLDYPAVIKIAEINFIEITPNILFKLQTLERYEIKRSKSNSGGEAH
jgi:hypothetical protein